MSRIGKQPVSVPSGVNVDLAGQEVKVKFLGMDDRGKVKLSMKRIDQVTGQEIEPAADAANG